MQTHYSMRKKTLLSIFSITFITIAILLTLLLSTKMPNDQNNGFTRKWLTTELKVLQKTSVSSELSTINGVSNSNIYLTGSNPRAILMLNKNFQKKDTFHLEFKAPENLLAPNTLTVDSPWLYLHINNLKTIIFGQFPDQKITLTQLNTEIFIRSVQISPSSLIIRVFDPNVQKQVFQKIDNTTGNVVKESLLIQDQSDAGFSTDGLLKYDIASNKIMYVEFFKNRLFCLDTNLNLIYKGHTIDTTFTNSVQVASKETGKGTASILPASARNIVNKNCFVNNRLLFVISALKADNERTNVFNQNTSIDVYQVEDGNYVGSFLVPHINNLTAKSITASNNTLFALYPGLLATFDLPIINQ